MKFYIIIVLTLVSLLPLASQAETLELKDVRGVSLPSFEWACVQYGAIYDFPLEETTALLNKWNLNTARLPLNQNCWLSSTEYRSEVVNVVEYLSSQSISTILDLHWNQPNGASSPEQQVMADKENSTVFWKSVATTFKNSPSVIAFELYNEPHSISWDCWLNGCLSEEGWKTAGMQDLVMAVRSTGAKQWLIVNGLAWANDVQGAVAHQPYDPLNKVAFGWHVYDEFDDTNKCTTAACFETEIKPLAKKVPIVITEFGSRLLCNPDHDERVMKFSEENNIGFVAWGWYPADCGFPSLIKDWSGTPTAAGYRLCNFLKGNCSPEPQKAELPTPLASVTPNTSSNTGHPICFISFKNGVLGNDNVTCTNGYQLHVTGAVSETWNDRVSSWRTEGTWIAVSGWDYYTTSGRIEKGNEILLPNTFANTTTEANDRTRFILLRPDFTGSLTVYEDIDSKGPSLTFTLQKK